LKKIKAYGICLYKSDEHSIKVLLCKSANSNERWGFLKGVVKMDEEPKETALREFQEECSITIKEEDLGVFFIQKNELKDIGIFLVPYDSNFNQYFNNDCLYTTYLSEENTNVEFFNIEDLPLIKKKQKYLTQEIVKHLTQVS
jgi:ADP-ribose pyrophosphatase YjhB (NUDIX family)